jgi:rhodanese-related sulfurtransferase
MEELKRTRRITIAAVVAIIVLLIAVFSYKKPIRYQMSAEEMAYELLMTYHVSPDEAMELMWDSTVVFVDLRNPYEYQADHLENAYSIPAGKLLEKENLALFDQWKEDSTRVVLYCNAELQTTSPWMILYQLGYTNTQILMGGMDYINALYSDNPPGENAYNVEAPRYDYAGIIEAAANASPGERQTQSQRKVVVRKKKKKAAEGGC